MLADVHAVNMGKKRDWMPNFGEEEWRTIPTNTIIVDQLLGLWAQASRAADCPADVDQLAQSLLVLCERLRLPTVEGPYRKWLSLITGGTDGYLEFWNGDAVITRWGMCSFGPIFEDVANFLVKPRHQEIYRQRLVSHGFNLRQDEFQSLVALWPKGMTHWSLAETLRMVVAKGSWSSGQTEHARSVRTTLNTLSLSWKPGTTP
jgi:hypothetical protein